MAAGVVTTSSREFRATLAGRSGNVQQVALATRELIRDLLPQVVEVVWPAQRSSGYGTGPKKNSEQFCWILAHNAHVALAFPFGGELDDPAGLLGGTGARVRNVRLATVEDVSQPELRALLSQAMRHRMPPAPNGITLAD